jgi:molecular chaperone GrpE (heat shock protein)
LIARLATIDRELKANRSTVATTDADQKKQGNQIYQAIDKTNKLINHLFEASSAMQGALDQRDAEIKRYREGYDVELLRRIVRRFIRVKGAIADANSHDATHTSAIHQVSRLLDDALEECGVEEFRPQIAEDFRTAIGVADNPKLIETSDQSRNFQIADVLEPGYRFRNTADGEVILPARVSIYVARKAGE